MYKYNFYGQVTFWVAFDKSQVTVFTFTPVASSNLPSSFKVKFPFGTVPLNITLPLPSVP